MTHLNRRRFLELGTIGGVLGAAVPGTEAAQGPRDGAGQPSDDRVVHLTGDGLSLTPAQYARLLARLADEKPIVPDAYILEGVVAELEAQWARVLGKERAVFMPTGTLANHLAVRTLAGGPSRVIVQAESHLYQDSGDCVQTLSNITLVPLGSGRASFTADEVQRVLDDTRSGRVRSRVSVISIETPVRRRQGQTFDSSELTKIVALARREGVRLHLDGARLFLQAAYTGQSPADYARPFDTVYVSLYKYFNAASGAILAGPRQLLDEMYHVRRMFGAGLYNAWPFAAVALHYLDGFGDRFGRAVRLSEDVIRELGRHASFKIERIPSGTNLFRLRLDGADGPMVRRRLAGRDIAIASPAADGTFLVAVNESWNRTTAAALAESFRNAIG